MFIKITENRVSNLLDAQNLRLVVLIFPKFAVGVSFVIN